MKKWIKKWIVEFLLENEKFIEALLTVIKAAMDLEFTDEEWEEIKQKAIAALRDLIG